MLLCCCRCFPLPSAALPPLCTQSSSGTASRPSLQRSSRWSSVSLVSELTYPCGNMCNTCHAALPTGRGTFLCQESIDGSHLGMRCARNAFITSQCHSERVQQLPA